jgi:flagellar biosynthetic protein FliP
MIRVFGIALVIFLALVSAAAAQTPSLSDVLPQNDTAASSRIIQLVALITVLSIAPGILVTVTCFTRFVIALSFLRAGLGLPTTPSNLILISLALFMTFFVMAPVADRVWKEGIQPYITNEITEQEAYERASVPLREFMLKHVREKDLVMFTELARERFEFTAVEPAQVDLRILVPAFMISEIRRGFEIGFLIIIPFLVIDLIVATITMSMGMMMMPPTTISLPFKILFFVLIDGWNLLVSGLINSYG